MDTPKEFKTVLAKLLSKPAERWKVQVKEERNLHLVHSVSSQGSLSEVEIDYQVENQAKFLLRIQQAPTLRWFSSQDGLEQLLEKSHISSKSDKLQLSSKDSTGTSHLVRCSTEFRSITEAKRVPELNIVKVHSLTRAQEKPSACEVPGTSTQAEKSDICDTTNILTSENVTEATTSDPEVNAEQNVSCQELTCGATANEHLSGCEEVSGKEQDCDACEPKAIRSAPILPSERTVFKTDDDVILVVEGRKVYVSKKLLSLHSEFFKAMFTSDMKESQQEEIELPSIKHSILLEILRFCRKGELHVSGDTAHHLLHTGHQFQLGAVIEMCEHFLVQIVRPDLLLELLDIADLYLLPRLLKSCVELIGSKFQQLVIQGVLRQLKLDHLVALLESDAHLPDATEFMLLRLVVEWVAKDVELNARHLDTLLSLIKFPLMQTTELSQVNKFQEPWLVENAVFQQQLKLAFKYKNCIHEQPLLNGTHTMPRAAVKTLALIVEDDSILSEMNSLDCHLVPIGSCSRIQTKTFITHKLKLEWFRDGYSVAALNNFMYIGGGYNPSGDQNLSSVHRYNPATGKWVSVQAMRHRRAAFVLCAFGNHLYAIGGRQFDSHLHAAFGLRAKTLSSVERYDCSKDSWSKAANLPIGLFAHAGTSCDGRLYVSGGRTDEPMGMEDTNALVSYDVELDVWIQCQAMTHNRYYHGMAAVDQKLYVAGGVNYNPSDAYGVWNFVTEPECYDTCTGQWTCLATMPHRRSQVVVTAVAKTVYVIGGLPHPGVDGKREVLEYSIERDQWQASQLKYPAFWPTQCCTLYFPESTIQHATRLSEFEKDRRLSSGREVLYSLSRVPLL